MADMMMPEEMKRIFMEAMVARMKEAHDDAWRKAFYGNNVVIMDKNNESRAYERWKDLRIYLRLKIRDRWNMQMDAKEQGLVSRADEYASERMALMRVLEKMDELEEG